jgi:hypothetical protein
MARVKFAIGLPQLHRLLLVFKQRICMNILAKAFRRGVIETIALITSLAAQADLPLSFAPR